MNYTHYLKLWPSHFAKVAEGRKKAELRRNDRDFQLGDTLVLCEWEPERKSFTGRYMQAVVTDVQHVPSPSGEFPMFLLMLSLGNRDGSPFPPPVEAHLEMVRDCFEEQSRPRYPGSTR